MTKKDAPHYHYEKGKFYLCVAKELIKIKPCKQKRSCKRRYGIDCPGELQFAEKKSAFKPHKATWYCGYENEKPRYINRWF
jgi:hypothetical protein